MLMNEWDFFPPVKRELALRPPTPNAGRMHGRAERRSDGEMRTRSRSNPRDVDRRQERTSEHNRPQGGGRERSTGVYFVLVGQVKDGEQNGVYLSFSRIEGAFPGVRGPKREKSAATQTRLDRFLTGESMYADQMQYPL